MFKWWVNFNEGWFDHPKIPLCVVWYRTSLYLSVGFPRSRFRFHVFGGPGFGKWRCRLVRFKAIA